MAETLASSDLSSSMQSAVQLVGDTIRLGDLSFADTIRLGDLSFADTIRLGDLSFADTIRLGDLSSSMQSTPKPRSNLPQHRTLQPNRYALLNRVFVVALVCGLLDVVVATSMAAYRSEAVGRALANAVSQIALILAAYDLYNHRK
jgi:hypothetical protein